jgi:hypothetical protein
MSDGGEASDVQRDRAHGRRGLDLPSRPAARLCLADLSESQQHLALALLDTGQSAERAVTARGVIDLDMICRQLSASPGLEPRAGDHR